MKLYDPTLIIALMVAAIFFGAHTVGKQYSPQYSEHVDRVKVHVQPYTDKAKEVYEDAKAKVLEFERVYVDPYRTPEDGIDNPVWDAN